MADDTPDESIEYKNDPDNCDHPRVSVRGRDGESDTGTSEWGTCQDCGKRVPNPAPGFGGPTGGADDRPSRKAEVTEHFGRLAEKV